MYDAIVVGLGGMGSAAAYHLALRRRRVLGLGRYAAAHSMGSGHGGTRIVRQAYFEDPAYVPLLLRAYKLYRVGARACMCTNTPDLRFVLSRHPRFESVAVAAGFSGHGYKFCSVVGGILADLATEGSTGHLIGLFSPARLAKEEHTVTGAPGDEVRETEEG